MFKLALNKRIKENPTDDLLRDRPRPAKGREKGFNFFSGSRGYKAGGSYHSKRNGHEQKQSSSSLNSLTQERKKFWGGWPLRIQADSCWGGDMHKKRGGQKELYQGNRPLRDDSRVNVQFVRIRGRGR